MANELKIGVVGYSPPTKFDEIKAARMINEAYDLLESQYPKIKKTVVSGLTNVGVPSIAYREAVKRGYKTIGVACEKAYDFLLFPVNESFIVGKEWGDESPKFLSLIDVIIRIGGGKQSAREVLESKVQGKQIIEYNLESIK